MNEKPIIARTCTYKIQYHVLWVVKDKRKVFDGKVAEKLTSIVYSIAQDKEFIIHDFKIIDSNQIDLIISAHPKLSVSYMIKMLKGISGTRLLKEHPEIKKELSKGELWNSSYYIETLGLSNPQEIEQYLSRQ